MRSRPTWMVGLLMAAALAAQPGARAEEPAAGVEEVQIKVGAARLEASLHRPAKPNGCGVVVAPGQSGGRARAIPTRLAEGLTAAGFTVLRLDWRFFTAKGQPSEGYAAEAEDLGAALQHLRSLPRITRVLVAGKSLGTLATAARLASAGVGADGLLMLTPALVQDEKGTPFPNVERLFETELPTVLIAGDHDPLCPLATLYNLVARAARPPPLVVVPGDHGLSKSREDASETDDNVALAVSATVLWAQRMAGAPAAPR